MNTAVAREVCIKMYFTTLWKHFSSSMIVVLTQPAMFIVIKLIVIAWRTDNIFVDYNRI